jgi:glycine dehydrogenase subunit 1
MPGRIAGQTVDRRGKRCWVLTLQTREQHIRREKATSNVCTNQGLLALRASVYMAAMGPKGMQQVAQLCFNKATYLANQLKSAGLSLKHTQHPFFNELCVQLKRPVHDVVQSAHKQGILPGYPIGKEYPELHDCLLIAVTEKRTKEEMDRLAEVLQ